MVNIQLMEEDVEELEEEALTLLHFSVMFEHLRCYYNFTCSYGIKLIKFLT